MALPESPPLKVDVFACKDYNDYYVYIAEGADVDAVLPDALRKRLGRLRSALTLELSAGTQLARATSSKVIEAIERDGFYLQLPPPTEGS